MTGVNSRPMDGSKFLTTKYYGVDIISYLLFNCVFQNTGSDIFAESPTFLSE